MKVKLLLICLIILCSCNRDINSCDNCKTMIGKLFFEVNKIEWGEVCIGKDYENIVRVYNPTHKDISMKIFTRLPESNSGVIRLIVQVKRLFCLHWHVILFALSLCHVIHL